VNPSSLIGPQHMGQRMRWVLLLPSAVLVLYTLTLVASGAPHHPPNAERLRETVSRLTTGEAGALMAVVVVSVLVLQPLQFAVVRALTGDWGDSLVARVLSWPGLWLHRRRRSTLEAASRTVTDGEPTAERRRSAATAAQLRRVYPPPEDLLPNRLGNALRAGQSRAGRRYGLEAAVLWPRIYPLLPQRVAGMIDDQRDQLDLCAHFCGVFLSATLITAGLLAPHGVWLILTIPTLLLALLCYQAAVAAAVLFGELLEVAFDLHRFDLLRALHLPLPIDRDGERQTNQLLSRFLLQGRPVNFSYEHAELPTADASD